MKTRFTSLLKPIFKSLVLIALVFTLAFGPINDAMAASRGGGRMGGGSFRASPSRSYSAPRSGGSYGGSYGGGYGGGSAFPFFLSPWLFFGGGAGGGGGLLSLLVVLALGSFAVQTFQRVRGEDGEGNSLVSSTVSVAKVQIGLLADARGLQTDLDRIASKANTSTTEGLAQILQETTLSILRHPEYWAYAGATAKQSRLSAAEAEFNQLALSERSKFGRETLSNVSGQLKQAGSALQVATSGELATAEPGEYIVVTIVVGTQGKLELPAMNDAVEVRQALSALGSISSDRLLALEVLWTPQSETEVLTSDDMLSDYPSLKLV